MPAFVAPPIEITRALSPDGDSQVDADSLEPEYIPEEQDIQVVYDFPDGRLRPLVHSALYIDGVLVDENKEPPFDLFTWDLQDYKIAGTYNLQVQARDAFDLVGTSIDTPVQITIEQPKSDPWAAFQRNIPFITALVVLVAGAILLLVLLLGGRLQPSTPGAIKNRRRKSDPVTQPVQVNSDSPRGLVTPPEDSLHGLTVCNGPNVKLHLRRTHF